MSEIQPRLFLERRSYRRRRWIDAARVLPFFGLALWCVPLIWPRGGELGGELGGAGGISLSQASIYIFAIWLVLVLVGAALSRLVDPALEGTAQDAAQPAVGGLVPGASGTLHAAPEQAQQADPSGQSPKPPRPASDLKTG